MPRKGNSCCRVPGCFTESRASGFCWRHLQRVYRTGSPAGRPPSFPTMGPDGKRRWETRITKVDQQAMDFLCRAHTLAHHVDALRHALIMASVDDPPIDRKRLAVIDSACRDSGVRGNLSRWSLWIRQEDVDRGRKIVNRRKFARLSEAFRFAVRTVAEAEGMPAETAERAGE